MLTDRSSSHFQSVALVSTLHDPEGNYLVPLLDRKEALSWYRSVYVCATEATDERLIAALRASGVAVELGPANNPGAGRRLSLELAVNDSHHAYQYCDFDRWLHWVGRFPDELAGLSRRIERLSPRPWYVCFGRTARAFASHPEVQRVAERATSRVLELVIDRKIDATAGSCWLSPEGAAIVIEQSVERTMGTDLEWPALIWQREPNRLSMIRTEGLEFESAEFATAAIAAAGSETAWVEQTYQQPEMWQSRFQLAADSIAALNRVIRQPIRYESATSSSSDYPLA